MGANHYGLPGYPIPNGYQRLYGPWLMHVTIGADEAGVLAAATATAEANIAASISSTGLPQIDHPLYSKARSNVTGTVVLTDGRPAGGLWALLSTEVATDVCEY